MYNYLKYKDKYIELKKLNNITLSTLYNKNSNNLS